MKKWTEEEVAYLKKHWNRDTASLSAAIGRTESAVSSKKQWLAEKGLAPGAEAQTAEAQTEVGPVLVACDEAKQDIPQISVTKALELAIEKGTVPYLVVRSGETVEFLLNGEKDIEDVKREGRLRIGDKIFEIRRKSIVGLVGY